MTSSADPGMITCVIPLGGEELELNRLLDALRMQAEPPAEIIIADDRPSEVSPLVRSRERVVRTKGRQGPAIARNLGAAAASGDYLLFIDADCLPPSEWAATLLAPLRAGEAEASFGRYSGTWSPLRLALLQHETMNREKARLAANPRVLSTSNMAIRTDVFREVGGFPDLRFHEDDVFGYRFSSRFRIRYVQEAAVAHRFHETWTGFFRQQFGWAHGMILAYAVEPALLTAGQSFGKERIIGRLAAFAVILLGLGLLPFALRPAGTLFLIAGAAWVESARREAAPIMRAAGQPLPWLRFFAVRDLAWLSGLTLGLIMHGRRLFRSLRKR